MSAEPGGSTAGESEAGDGRDGRTGASGRGGRTGASGRGRATEAADSGASGRRYVHRPDGVATPTADRDGEMGRRGWVLVGVVVLCTLVIPGIIYLWPSVPTRAGLPFLAAMLVLPMVPAILLGVTAVWSMTISGRSDHPPGAVGESGGSRGAGDGTGRSAESTAEPERSAGGAAETERRGD